MDVEKQLREHKHAPQWNYEATDLLDEGALACIRDFEAALTAQRASPALREQAIATKVREILGAVKNRAQFFKDAPAIEGLPETVEALPEYPTTDRQVLAEKPWAMVPDKDDYSDMVMYYTTGTTGNPVGVPQHPVSVGMYGSFLKEVLARWDVHPDFHPDRVGIVLVGYQNNTVTFPTRLSVFNDAGFAKINLKAGAWTHPHDPCLYLRDINPPVLTGDPISFSVLAHLYEQANVDPCTPRALVATAVALAPSVRAYLADFFGCPVIDWYSLTETGPLGYTCPQNAGYHLLPTDVHVELLDAAGNPVRRGEPGEITVTGGRNPYLPLLRYRTGDWGRLETAPCPCGDPTPRIVDLEGRCPVVFQTAAGTFINNADVAATLRPFPILEYAFKQFKDLTCLFRFALIPSKDPAEYLTEIETALATLFGTGVPITVQADPGLVDRPRDKKLVAFESEIPFFYTE